MQFKLPSPAVSLVPPPSARWSLQEPWLDSQDDPADAPERPRVLLVCGLTRDGSDEVARSLRLVDLARAVFDAAGVLSEVLDLGRLGSGCHHRAVPGAGWGHADGVLILTPAHWRRTSNVLQMMIARGVGLAAASTDGAQGPAWWTPQSLGERAYGLVVHGDLHRALEIRHALCDWLDWMGLIDACEQARLEHFIGLEAAGDLPALPPEGEAALEHEVRAAAWALVHAVDEIRAGRLTSAAPLLARAWPR